MTIEIKNAVITGTMLGVEDHGILSAFVYLDYGGSAQGFGGYALDSNAGKRWLDGGNVCGRFVRRVLETVGVERWEDLKGKNIRVKSDWGKVYAIANILRDNWYDPSEDFKSLEKTA